MSSSKVNKIKILGHGKVTPEGMNLEQCPSRETKYDLTKILKDRKAMKFFSKQDGLTLAACHQAWSQANINDPDYADRTGIYLCVGILPFEDKPLEKIAMLSQSDGKLDMHKSSTDSFNAMNPLLTFKCLPNMPLFHVSSHFGITGRYFMTYPGIPEWFSALNRAIEDLQQGLVDYAIVGSAADQNNYLVSHHLRRIRPDLLEKSIDACSALVLTTREEFKPIGHINTVETRYKAFNPLENKSLLIQNAGVLPVHAGVVEPSLYLTLHLEKATATTVTYTWQGDADNFCKIEMEVL